MGDSVLYEDKLFLNTLPQTDAVQTDIINWVVLSLTCFSEVEH